MMKTLSSGENLLKQILRLGNEYFWLVVEGVLVEDVVVTLLTGEGFAWACCKY
jgi:hypothetical protein